MTTQKTNTEILTQFMDFCPTGASYHSNNWNDPRTPGMVGFAGPKGFDPGVP